MATELDDELPALPAEAEPAAVEAGFAASGAVPEERGAAEAVPAS